MARQPVDGDEEKRIRRPAGARHAPGDWILRARIVTPSREGLYVPRVAALAGCDAKTVRRWLHRFNEQGPGGLGDRPGCGRKRRITEAERSRIVALVKPTPPGRPEIRPSDELWVAGGAGPPEWPLDSPAAEAGRPGDGETGRRGIEVGRSRVRRRISGRLGGASPSRSCPGFRFRLHGPATGLPAFGPGTGSAGRLSSVPASAARRSAITRGSRPHVAIPHLAEALPGITAAPPGRPPPSPRARSRRPPTPQPDRRSGARSGYRGEAAAAQRPSRPDQRLPEHKHTGSRREKGRPQVIAASHQDRHPRGDLILRPRVFPTEPSIRPGFRKATGHRPQAGQRRARQQNPGHAVKIRSPGFREPNGRHVIDRRNPSQQPGRSNPGGTDRVRTLEALGSIFRVLRDRGTVFTDAAARMRVGMNTTRAPKSTSTGVQWIRGHRRRPDGAASTARAACRRAAGSLPTPNTAAGGRFGSALSSRGSASAGFLSGGVAHDRGRSAACSHGAVIASATPPSRRPVGVDAALRPGAGGRGGVGGRFR
ncbi:helix-turn-helix domain-containing protein [Embleya sp. AB8]|uniref:helix-turn-helix domain-containing protein n=1 Tax=Embleya sp. AB8 TaxID=3156304 RepID=UPI003C78EBBF